jgi:hypothetical protein
VADLRRYSRSRPALNQPVRPAGELLGLSPPAAPREIVLLVAVLVNAYNTYLVDHTRPRVRRLERAPSVTRRCIPPRARPSGPPAAARSRLFCPWR